MGKRSVGVGVWLAFGALVLVAVAPKEVWIWLGVIGVSALIAYLAIKHPSKKGGRDTHQHEPTLAELIAKSEPQRSARRPTPPPADRPRTPPEHQPVKNRGQSSEWSATRQATIDVNRERAQALRNRFPPTLPLTNVRINAPVHPAPPASLPPRAPQNSIRLADTPSGSQATELPDQSVEWNALRQATIDANRERAQALRDKFHSIPSRTNEKTRAPVQLTASPITLQPTTPTQVSERAITLSSPSAFSSPSSTTVVSAPNSERISGDSMRLLQGSCETERMYSATEITKPPVTHVLPAAPAGFGDGRWVPPGESIEVAGVDLPGGMLYVGGRLKALNGGTEPCLISGQHTVARAGNYRAPDGLLA